jgi:anti-anti-sigma regulatory factor
MSLTRKYDDDSWSLIENGQTLLVVREIEKDGKILITLAGTLRSDMEQMFRDELIALISVGMDVILDCKDLQYMANACQDALLFVQQTADGINRGTLTLQNVPEPIYAEFEKTNLHELLMIE